MKWYGRKSPYTGRFKNRWPIYVDPQDIRYVYFRDHDDHSWHALTWEHADGSDAPLGDEALKHIRRKAAQKYRFVDDVLALDELLTRWHVDSNSSAADRRVALNLARHDALSQQAHPDETQPAPNIRRAATTSTDSPREVECSDDDIDGELDPDYEPPSSDDYYNSALEDL